MGKYVSVNKIKTQIIYNKTYKMNALDLSRQDISEISQIKVLQDCKSLNLDLSFNEITEIEDLEKLKNLISLRLNYNKITEIKGIESLNKLKYLRIGENNISKNLIQQLGGLDIEIYANNPQKFIGYCKEEE